MVRFVDAYGISKCSHHPHISLGATADASDHVTVEPPMLTLPCAAAAAAPSLVGTLSALYEQRLSTGERFVLSTQLDTLNIGGKAPKVGFALDLA